MSSSAAVQQHRHHTGGGSGLVPLAALIKEEVRTERRDVTGTRICAREEEDRGRGEAGEAQTRRPLLRYGCAAQSKKGEDFFLLRTDCARSSSSTSSHAPTFAVFAVSLVLTARLLSWLVECTAAVGTWRVILHPYLLGPQPGFELGNRAR